MSLECNNENIPFYYAAQAGICCACELQKGHCYWVTPKGIFNDKNKGKIQIIVDKVGRVKTKQWESAASVSFFSPLSCSFLFNVSWAVYSPWWLFTSATLLKGSPLFIFCMEVSGKGFPCSIAHTASLLCVPQTKINVSRNLHNYVLFDSRLGRQGRLSLSQRSSLSAVHHRHGDNCRLCMYFSHTK